MRISETAAALIIDFETGGEAGYNPHPCWPGGSSGVTIGIGCDLGYQRAEDIAGGQAGWAELPADARGRLSDACGITGAAAREMAAILSDITVPWPLAERLFREHAIPKAEAETLSIYPNAAELSGDSFGALVSLVYNRGTSLAGPRRAEMANIATMIEERRWPGVADEIRAMRRLWPDARGLRERRDREAALYTVGLSSATKTG